MKKIFLGISAAAVLVTSAIAAKEPRCTIYNFLDQGKNYMKNIKKTEIYKSLTGDFGEEQISNIEKSIRMRATIEGGIREGAVQRIKDDLALTDMTLHLRDKNGQTYTINLQDATLNAYKYFYVHLYNMLKTKDSSYRNQFAAAAIDISDFLFLISKYDDIAEAYKKFSKFAKKSIPLKSQPFMALVLLKEAKNMQKLSYNQKFWGFEFGSITTGVVRGYIVAQRDPELRKYIPQEFLDFAFYVITGNFNKADKIVLKEIQKGGGFTGIMQYCLVEQIIHKKNKK